MSSVPLTSISTALDNDNIVSQSFQSLLLEEQIKRLQPTIEKIQRLSDEQLSKIATLTMRRWLKDLKQQPCLKNATQIFSLPIYASLVGMGTLTSYSSINLLYNANFSQALSSNKNLRVSFANNITNAGALFACITDFPAITYCLYLFVFEKAHRDTVHEILNESYLTCVNKDQTLTPEMHEELYQRHILNLQHLGLDNFYLHPDVLSQTGAIYDELAPILEEIDRELKNGVSIRKLGENCIESFKQDPCTKKLVKITAGSISLAIMTFSSFIILENIILLKDTPVNELFSNNRAEESNEAFYLTQLGGLFSSLTAFGAAAYISFRSFLRTPYKKTLCEKINDCFTQYTPVDLSNSARNALYRIKEFKIFRVNLT